MADPNTPVLDFDTSPDARPKVRIDGRLYPIRHVEDLAIHDIRRAWNLYGQMATLLNKPSLTKKEEKGLNSLLGETCRLVLEAPPAVHKKLKVVQRLQVTSVFSTLLPPMTTGATPTFLANQTRARSTGAKRSLG